MKQSASAAPAKRGKVGRVDLTTPDVGGAALFTPSSSDFAQKLALRLSLARSFSDDSAARDVGWRCNSGGLGGGDASNFCTGVASGRAEDAEAGGGKAEDAEQAERGW